MGDDTSLNADGNISEFLINFVGDTPQAFGFDQMNFGKGVLYNIRHPQRYYEFIPMFYRLQEFVYNENQTNSDAENKFKSKAQLRNFRLYQLIDME